VSAQWVDAPATTSAVTYKVQAWTYYLLYLNRGGEGADQNYIGHSVSTLTAIEVR
jgi:hypothetical protein